VRDRPGGWQDLDDQIAVPRAKPAFNTLPISHYPAELKTPWAAQTWRDGPYPGARPCDAVSGGRPGPSESVYVPSERLATWTQVPLNCRVPSREGAAVRVGALVASGAGDGLGPRQCNVEKCRHNLLVARSTGDDYLIKLAREEIARVEDMALKRGWEFQPRDATWMRKEALERLERLENSLRLG